jgi:hypothetical protein
MKRKVDLYLEQEEIHNIIREYFKLGDVPMESDVNAGRTTFTYETKEEDLECEKK